MYHLSEPDVDTVVAEVASVRLRSDTKSLQILPDSGAVVVEAGPTADSVPSPVEVVMVGFIYILH